MATKADAIRKLLNSFFIGIPLSGSIDWLILKALQGGFFTSTGFVVDVGEVDAGASLFVIFVRRDVQRIIENY